MHIASLEAHTTLNKYNLWKLVTSTLMPERGIELGTF